MASSPSRSEVKGGDEDEDEDVGEHLRYESGLNTSMDSDDASEVSRENGHARHQDHVRTTSNLKRLCEISLCKSVDLANVIDLLAYAEALDARALADYCATFIRINFDALLVGASPSMLSMLRE